MEQKPTGYQFLFNQIEELDKKYWDLMQDYDSVCHEASDYLEILEYCSKLLEGSHIECKCLGDVTCIGCRTRTILQNLNKSQ